MEPASVCDQKIGPRTSGFVDVKAILLTLLTLVVDLKAILLLTLVVDLKAILLLLWLLI